MESHAVLKPNKYSGKLLNFSEFYNGFNLPRTLREVDEDSVSNYSKRHSPSIREDNEIYKILPKLEDDSEDRGIGNWVIGFRF